MTAVETKIELVTEAIESLVLAQVAALKPGHDRFSGPLAHENVVAARKDVHDALKELMTPTLRVITSEREDRAGDISTTHRRTVAEANFPA